MIMKSDYPIPVQERFELLDVIRGFALLGIYISIISGFNSSLQYGSVLYTPHHGLDQFIGSLETLFISKRFIGIFSLLFGIGIAIQQQKFRSKNASFTPYFLRRMFVLAVFGLINTTLFWWGEILLVYAIFGVLMLLLSRLNTKILLLLAFILFTIVPQLFEYAVRDNLIQMLIPTFAEFPAERVRSLYTSGPIHEIIQLRWREYIAIYTDNNFHLGASIALMICGYIIGAKGLHKYFLENLPKTQKIFKAALLITIGYAIYGLISGNTFPFFFDTPVVFLAFLIFLPASMFVYIYALTAAYANKPNWLLRQFARNGRLALTGYMGGACVFSLIFYYPGLALYLKYGTTIQVLIAILTYVGFSIFSTFWLRKFRYGPLEWLYRRLSYGKI